RHRRFRVFRFARGNDRGFESDESVDQKQNGGGKIAGRGRRSERKIPGADEENADGGENQQRQNFPDREDIRRDGRLPNARDVYDGRPDDDDRNYRSEEHTSE